MAEDSYIDQYRKWANRKWAEDNGAKAMGQDVSPWTLMWRELHADIGDGSQIRTQEPDAERERALEEEVQHRKLQREINAEAERKGVKGVPITVSPAWYDLKYDGTIKGY
jgi:hypothetical protein